LDQITLRVIETRPETPDTTTFILQTLVEGRPISVDYRPGQFITLLIRHYGREVRRSFSLSSYPGAAAGSLLSHGAAKEAVDSLLSHGAVASGDSLLSITVKRKPNGEISRHLLDHIKVGDTLACLPPAGRFTLTTLPGSRRDIGFIAAGSGISPIYPLILQALTEEPSSHVWLVYQNHSETDIIFSDALSLLKQTYPERFTILHLLSAPLSHQLLPTRLNNANLEQLVPGLLRYDHSDALFFCCGPLPFMRMARFTLRVMGFREDQFRQEHFTVDALPPAPILTDTAPKTVRLNIRGAVSTFTASYPTNILQAALDQHIPLHYSCRGGRCSACAVRCLSGKVVMSINDVLTDKDLSEGWVLTCTGYAETDIELDA